MDAPRIGVGATPELSPSSGAAVKVGTAGTGAPGSPNVEGAPNVGNPAKILVVPPLGGALNEGTVVEAVAPEVEAAGHKLVSLVPTVGGEAYGSSGAIGVVN